MAFFILGQAWYARDEGDGRSMTDSQYSGYSPGGATGVGGARAIPKPSPPSLTSRISHLKLKDYDQEITVLEEKEIQQTAPVGPPCQPNAADKLRPLEVAQYINSQFKMPPRESPKSTPPPLVSPSGNTKHPQQIWSRDRNGGLTYTGMFSSDC